jgi:hypothetical protein
VSWHEQSRRLDARERLLAMEADLQRATLVATLRKWEQHKLLTIGSTLASWGWRLLAVPKVRWLVAASVLSRLRGRRRHA